MHEYMVGNLLFLAVWLFFYISREDLRHEILVSSLWIMPVGLTQTLFVPTYWDPPSLFSVTIGAFYFDVESLMHAFLIGGVAAAGYETVFQRRLEEARESRETMRRHAHILVGTVVVTTFLLYLVLGQFMFPAIIGLFTGAIAVVVTRRDLWQEVIGGGLVYVLIHVTILLVAEHLLFPGIVDRVWTVDGLLATRIAGIPLGEIVYAFAFGMAWAPFYEEIRGYTLSRQ